MVKCVFLFCREDSMVKCVFLFCRGDSMVKCVFLFCRGDSMVKCVFLFCRGDSMVKCVFASTWCKYNVRTCYLFVLSWARVRQVCLLSVSSVVFIGGDGICSI